MSRRKLRGLTRTGRQVSEDPDLDNLLSNLSPEEMEELQKEVSTVPDPDPSEIIIADQPDLNQTTGIKRDANLPNQDIESRTVLQRNLPIEGGLKRESRKKEYLRKMGLSQEKTTSMEGGLQRENSISTQNETSTQAKTIEETPKGIRQKSITLDSKDFRVGHKEDESTKIFSANEKGQNDHYKIKEVKESSRQTKELSVKLRDKKDGFKERDRKVENQKRESGDKTNTIFRLQGKLEGIEKRESRPKRFISEIEEKQNQDLESKTDESKNVEEKKIDKQPDLVKFCVTEKDVIQKKVGSDDSTTNKENEVLKKDKEFTQREKHKKEKEMTEVQERLRLISVEGAELQQESEIQNENNKSSPNESLSTFMSETPPKTVNNQVEEEDESASIFAEDLDKIRNNDPRMTELNINNSDVIKVKTLIQFAESLNNNTHVKILSLANCRADDHVAFAVAGTLRNNKTINCINMDSNLLTSKGIMALVQALQYNYTLTELRFQNQRHICGGKTEMEMTKVLKENTALLKLGYHFELAGPRMTMTNILSRNMDRHRQKRLQEQKHAQAQGHIETKGFNHPSQINSPKPSTISSPVSSPKTSSKTPKGPCGSQSGFFLPPPPPNLDSNFLKNSLTLGSQRKLVDKTGSKGGSVNSRDQLLASIRGSNIKQLKKVALPKLLQ